MHYLELPPLAPLNAIVHCFWFLRSDATGGTPQPVVADGRFDIILHCAEPFVRWDQDRGTPQADALLAGQLTQPVHLVQRGSADVVGIRLRTSAAAALFRHSPVTLTNQIEPLAEIAPALRDGLLRAANQHATPHARRDALSQVLSRLVLTPPDALAMSAVQALDCSAPPTIERLSAQLGLSVRSLERRVGQATGLPPRTLVRALRFRRVFRRLESAAPGTMTQVALDAGYFDQAHCIREFRRFAGLAPSAFFRQAPAMASAFLG